MLYFAQNQFLGNQLWPLATIISFAMRHGLTVASPYFTRHSENFPYFADDRYCRYPRGTPMPASSISVTTDSRFLLRVGKALGLVETIICPLDSKVDLNEVATEQKIVCAAQRRIVYMHGLYFLAHDSLRASRDEIRTIFRIQENLWTGVRETIATCRSRGDIVVGLHVRWGDYVGAKDDMVFSLDDYRLLAKQAQDLFYPKKVVFLICSTEPIPATKFHPYDVVSAPGHYVQDMYCLANVDVIVGPPSTYSQWASFYGNVPVFNINKINEMQYGLPVSVPANDNFNVNESGCGRHSVKRSVNLKELGLT